MSDYVNVAVGEPFCRERDRTGYTCTREDGHDGPHAAHDGFGVPPCFVWDDSGPLYDADNPVVLSSAASASPGLRRVDGDGGSGVPTTPLPPSFGVGVRDGIAPACLPSPPTAATHPNHINQHEEGGK